MSSMIKASASFAICLAATVAFLTSAASGQATGIRPEAPVGKGIVVLKAARLIDGRGGPVISNGVVVVTDDRITAVGPARGVKVPARAPG